MNLHIWGKHTQSHLRLQSPAGVRADKRAAHHEVPATTEHLSGDAAVGAAGVFRVENVATRGEEPLLNKEALIRLHSNCRRPCETHLFTTQFPWTNSATCWMHRSTEVESVPEANRPIRLAN